MSSEIEGQSRLPASRARILAQGVLFAVAILNLAAICAIAVGAKPDQREPIAVAATSFVNLGMSLALLWSASLIGKGRSFAPAIGMLGFLATCHTMIPLVFWLAGKHEGGRLIIATQTVYSPILIAAFVVVSVCALQPAKR